MPVHVERVVLPGIGVRHDILTADGRRLSVVSFRDGGRELAISDEDDPDRADETIALTDDEATALSEVLGGTLLLTQLAGLRGQVAGLHMEQIPVRADSPYVGRTWVSSSGVVAKVLHDLGRLTNRETPVVLSVLVIEDLAMAFYLPVLTALLIGAGLGAGLVSVALALASVLVILYIALRHGAIVSKVVWSRNAEVLLLSVLGLTLLVSGLAAQVQVSAAVGAFLVGIAISGPAAEHATRVLTPLRDLFAAVFFLFFGLSTDPSDLVPMFVPAIILAVVTMATKVLTGYIAARRAGIGEAGRWRAGFVLTPRGEFSIVIAGLAVGSGVDRSLAALATAYVLITIAVALGRMGV